MWSGERDHGTSQLTRRMVTHKHAPDELSQQTVTDSRFAARPPFLFGEMVVCYTKPPIIGGLVQQTTRATPTSCWLAWQTAQLWWSGVQDRVNLVFWAQDRVFWWSACPNHHQPYGLRLSATATTVLTQSSSREPYSRDHKSFVTLGPVPNLRSTMHNETMTLLMS